MHLIATPLHFISFDIVSCWRCCCTLYMDVVRANRQHSLRIQMPVLKPATTFNHIGWTLTYISIATMDVWFFAVLYSEWIGSDKAPKVLSCISKPRHRKHRFFSLSDWNSIRLASLQHTKRSQLFVCCAHDIHMQSILFTRTTTTKQLAINTDTHTNGSLSCTQFALYPIRSLAYAFPITPSFASISSVFVRQTHQTVWTERYCLCCILFCVLSAFLESNCAR